MNTEENLLNTGFEFLAFGINLLLLPSATETDIKVSVANIQVGLELLIKYRLAKDYTLQHICTTNIQGLSHHQIQEGVQKGTIKSKKFELCKHSFVQSESISGYEHDLIEKFQRLRNSIVHFSIDIPREETISTCAHLVLKVVRRIVEREADPWLSRYLPKDVYQALIDFPAYQGEAVDDAYASGKDVRLCFECNNETLTTLPGREHYCFSCGYRMLTEHAPYIDCPYCKGQNTAVYDSLNSTEDIYRGKCLSCKEKLLIAKCVDCEIETFPEIFAKMENDKWYCDSCYEDRVAE